MNDPSVRADPWFHPAGASATDGWDVHVPAAGTSRNRSEPVLTYAGLAVRTMAADDVLTLAAGATEHLVVPLSGTYIVHADDAEYTVGRAGDVFEAAPDVLYLPAHTPAVLQAQTGGQVALASAPTTVAHPIQFRGADQVQVEHRGSAPAARQVRDLGGEHALDAERLLVCEVLTPPGGWSSYPPHKHDEHVPGTESELEEIYYFHIARAGGAPARDHAVGYHRTFASDERDIDTLAEVRSGDVALVPYGWHGPCMAPPGYRMYYLNVMAGPGQRTWEVTFHPDLEWTRS